MPGSQSESIRKPSILLTLAFLFSDKVNQIKSLRLTDRLLDRAKFRIWGLERDQD